MFTVTAKPQEKSNSLHIAVFLNHDKRPIFGTSFTNTTPLHEIVKWAETECKQWPKQQSLFSLQ
jgi:hypothetical protein